MTRGQSLLELAICAPVILLLTVGAAATVQVADATAGLEGATEAAAAVAARAPDPATAQEMAQQRFASIIAGYPLSAARLTLTVGDFGRAGRVAASASGTVDLSWAGLMFPHRFTLESSAVLPLESWRSHSSP